MKKLLLFMAVALWGINPSFSQSDLTLGVNVGIPTGDVSDFTDFHLGADLSYLMGPTDGFQIGPMVGYSRFFVEEVDDIQFLPIAASGRILLSEAFFLGADLGYALGVSDGNDGGFYYRPKLGFSLFGLGLIASYSGISMDGGSFSSINLGMEFRL